MTVEATARPSRHALGEPLPIRVGFAGTDGMALLGGGVDAVALDPGGEPGDLAAVVVDERPAGFDRAEVERLAGAAGEAGAIVVGLATGGGAPAWAGLADLAAGLPGGPADQTVTMAPPVDTRVFNPPKGFRDLDAAGFAAVLSGPTDAGGGLRRGLDALAAVAEREPVLALAPTRTPLPGLAPTVQRAPLPAKPGSALRRLRPRLGIVDHPAFHSSEWERAGWIVRLCAAGLPVVAADVTTSLAELTGSELAGLLDGVAAHDLEDLHAREQLSVAIRRTAMRDCSVEAAWRRICGAAGIELPARPMVSVILATRREDWLEHALGQIERQTYQPRELVVALHGDGFAEDIESRIRSLATAQPVKVVRPDGDLVLGEALNVGVTAADGELITKMDDDDYYNTDHLWDLVLACEYAEADLVGKGAEFVYLEWVDLTIRRFMGDSESDHPRLAGGGLMARAEPLRAIGGWPARRTGEDTWLVKNMKRAGRRTYRTHGFGYILNRHGRGHTWNTYLDYFLVQSQHEWRGLRLDLTAVD